MFADCALHTHAVILSIAKRADTSVGRLDGRPLFAWKMAAGAVYHQALAAGMRRLGFAIEVTGKNGMFDVAGVDADLIDYFSARRAEINQELSELDLVSGQAPALAAAKALVTRQNKQQVDTQDRDQLWQFSAAKPLITPFTMISASKFCSSSLNAIASLKDESL